MTARVRTAWAGIALALALLAGAPTALAGPTCNGSHSVDQTLATGARWQFCWEHHINSGIIYSEIYYSPPGGGERMVLAELSLAQIHVPYDDNGARFHDVTDYGAGGSNLNNLASTDCPQGTRLQDGGKNVLCKKIRARGAAYDAIGDQQQGSLLELFSVSHIGAYNYIPTYRFIDDGAIEILMGATGQLQRFANNDPSQVIYGWPLDAASNRIGISHIHNYYYRIDFEIGGTALDDVFERIDVTADGSASTRTKTITAFTSEGGDDIAPDLLRSWRVRDASLTNGYGHAISYELVPLESGHRDVGPSYEPFTNDVIYVTRYKNNERYVSHNDIIPGAPENVTEFYAPPEAIAGGADIVVWYGLTFHHIPRDEDESKMHAHWSGFRIEPRDWVNAHPLVTNLPPVLANPGDQQSAVGAAVSLQLQASDPELAALIYAAFGLPPGLGIDTATGRISGTLGSSAGTYSVEVRADDGNSFDSESFTWTVSANDPPVWTNPGPQANGEGDAVSVQLTATNPDGPPPTYSASGLPPGLSINPTSGLVSGLLGYASAGVYGVVATAADDLYSVDQPFTWTVSNVNRAPVWTDPGTQTNAEGQSVSLQLVATDPDGQVLQFSATGLPPGLYLDANTGVVSGLLGYESSGEYAVTATVTDGAAPVQQPFTWSVSEAPAPGIPALPPLGLVLGLLAMGSVGAFLLRRRR